MVSACFSMFAVRADFVLWHHRISQQQDAGSSISDLWLICFVRVFPIDETVNVSLCSVGVFSIL